MNNYLKKNKLLLCVTMAANVVSAGASVLIALLLQKILDAALEGDTGPFVRIF